MKTKKITRALVVFAIMAAILSFGCCKSKSGCGGHYGMSEKSSDQNNKNKQQPPS